MYEQVPEPIDPETQALRTAVAEFQDAIDRHMRMIGRSIDALNEDEQQELVDVLRPYIKFEFEQSEGIWTGLPFCASGTGGFLAANAEGLTVAAQHMAGDDSITGTVEDVWPYPVPALSCMLDAGDGEHDVFRYSQSLSAVIILQDATCMVRDNSGAMQQHDLSQYQILIPITYGMDISVPDKPMS